MKMNMTKESGFTLVELLVALLIGLLLAAAIVTIYLGSQSTFRAAQGVSRSQETTRFAVHFLKTDIRQAGYLGCSEGIAKQSFLDQANPNYNASFDSSIFGWEFEGTSSGDTYILNYDVESGDSSDAEIATARGNNSSDDPGMWDSQFISTSQEVLVPRTLPQVILDLQPFDGSDIVSVTIAEPLVVGDNGAQPGQPVYISALPDLVEFNLNAVDIDGNAVIPDIPNGGIISVGDCSSVDTFQNTATAGDDFFSIDPAADLSPGNAITGLFEWQKKWDESASLFTSKTSVYFVGTGASGIPSLFRYTSNCGLIDNVGSDPGCEVSVVELVEGVENMQVMYGEDSDDDGVPNQLLPADEVSGFDNVVSVELGILVRSIDTSSDIDNTTVYVLAGNTSIDPPDDRFQRFVSNTTIRLHNQGL